MHKWLNGFLFEEAGDDGDEAGGGGDKGKSDKVKIGDKEYDPKSAASAISLYEALQDESTGAEIIRTLAESAGLLKGGKPAESREETKKELESRSAKLLRAKLGKDYEKFADTVGPAFDDIIREFLQEEFGKRDSRATETTWANEVDKFLENHGMTSEIEETMKELMEDSPPNFGNANFKSQRYLTRMYKNALEELEMEAPASKPAKKGSSRKNDDDLPDIVVRDAPKNVTLDDAIDAAMRGIRFRRQS